jgi:hypothetical protein
MATESDLFFMECTSPLGFDKDKLIVSSLTMLMSGFQRSFLMNVRFVFIDGFYITHLTGIGIANPEHLLCFKTIEECVKLFSTIQKEHKHGIKVAFSFDKTIPTDQLSKFVCVPREQIEMEKTVRHIIVSNEKDTQEKKK